MASQLCSTAQRFAGRNTDGGAVHFGADERGSVIILSVFVIISLLAFVGLAVDSGNLYRARLRLHAAADAGALGGIATTILQHEKVKGQAFPDLKVYVEDRAREIVLENLRQYGITVNPAADIAADLRLARPPGAPLETPERLLLAVEVVADVDLLIMDVIPFDFLGVGSDISPTIRVGAASARAVAERSPANVSLVLDLSRSMACPANGDCSCNMPGRTETCEAQMARTGELSKLALLKEAINEFLDHFNPAIDRISLVPFNVVASLNSDYVNGGQAVPFKSTGTGTVAEPGFDREDFDLAADNFTATSVTNICDGMARAYEESVRAGLAENPNLPRDEEVSYVLFSDGAPTAGRFRFANPTADLPSTGLSKGIAVHDYVNYSLYWADTSGDASSGARWFSPSPLVAYNRIEIGHAETTPPPASVPACSDHDGQPNPDQSQTGDVFAPGCLQNLAAAVPGMDDKIYGAEYGDSKPYSTWREQYYNCAVEASDLLRNGKGTVYSVGLGNPAAGVTDPYQNIEDTLMRKDVLLARIANDFTTASRLPLLNGTPVHTEFAYSGYRTYSELQSAPYRREGSYHATSDAATLKNLYKKLAIQIQLRLID